MCALCILQEYSTYERIWIWYVIWYQQGMNLVRKTVWSGMRKLLFTGVAFSGIVLEISCESDQWFCEDSAVFLLQGAIVFVLGLNVAFDSVVECVLFAPLSALEPKSIYAAAFTTFGLPAVWLLLAGSTIAERTYFCGDMLCAAKHYLYPSIMVLASNAVCGSLRSLWSVWIFKQFHTFNCCIFRNSIKGPAANVLLIFLCLVLTTAAIAMPMFKGVYKLDNYYSDTKFYDFYESTTTVCKRNIWSVLKVVCADVYLSHLWYMLTNSVNRCFEPPATVQATTILMLPALQCHMVRCIRFSSYVAQSWACSF